MLKQWGFLLISLHCILSHLTDVFKELFNFLLGSNDSKMRSVRSTDAFT